MILAWINLLRDTRITVVLGLVSNDGISHKRVVDVVLCEVEIIEEEIKVNMLPPTEDFFW